MTLVLRQQCADAGLELGLFVASLKPLDLNLACGARERSEKKGNARGRVRHARWSDSSAAGTGPTGGGFIAAPAWSKKLTWHLGGAGTAR